MAQQTTLNCILEAISDDDSLKEALWAHFLPGTNQNTKVDGRHVDSSVVTSQQTNPDLASQIGQSGGGPGLPAHSLQSGSTNSHHRAVANVNPLVSHIRQLGNSDPVQETQDEGAINSGGHQLEIQHAGKQLEPNNDHMQPQISNPTSLNFDPDLFYNEDDNTVHLWLKG